MNEYHNNIAIHVYGGGIAALDIVNRRNVT